MKKIKVVEIYASSDEGLEIDLNNLHATRIISVENIGEYRYRVIYEEATNN